MPNSSRGAFILRERALVWGDAEVRVAAEAAAGVPWYPGQAVLEQRIKEICQTRVRYGYRRIHVLLRREGCRHGQNKDGAEHHQSSDRTRCHDVLRKGGLSPATGILKCQPGT